MLELNRVPAQVALDTLRTVRNGLDSSLEADGTMSGRIAYAPGEAPAPVPSRNAGGRAARNHAPPPGPLSGSITVNGLRVSGDGLRRAIVLPKVTVTPAPGSLAALAASVAIPLGAPTPLNVSARLALDSYEIGIRGGAALARLRELAHLTGLPHASILDKLDAPHVTLDLTADGPWLRSPAPPIGESDNESSPVPVPPPVLVSGPADRVSGTLTLREAIWKPDFLANPVEVAGATLRFDQSGATWDPVAFSYGPVRGTATVNLPAACLDGEKCTPQFTAEFASLDAAALQAALLGVRTPGTLLSTLLGRFRPGSEASWPELEGTARAATLLLGPVTLKDVEASLHLQSDAAEIESLDAGLLGGRIHAGGSIALGDKPDYKLEGRFERVRAAELGRLLGMTWTGNAIDGDGKVELVGFTDKDLADSATGLLHFDWRHGAIAENDTVEAPAVLARFDRWTADAEIAHGSIALKKNQVQRGARKLTVSGSAEFGDPPRVTFGEPEEIRASAGKQAKP
jgi:hypothetical protein